MSTIKTLSFKKPLLKKKFTKDLKDIVRVKFQIFLRRPRYGDFEASGGESKLGRYIIIRDNLDDDVDRSLNTCFESENEFKSLQGGGVKNFIATNILDVWTRLEIMLGLQLSGHTDTLSKASILVDEKIKRGGIDNEQQNRSTFD